MPGKNLETIVTSTLLHDYCFFMFGEKCANIFFKQKRKENIFYLLAMSDSAWEIELPYGQVQISQIVFCEIQIPSGKVQISQVVFSCTPAKKKHIFSRICFVFFFVFLII